jgi:hypothetical protein
VDHLLEKGLSLATELGYKGMTQTIEIISQFSEADVAIRVVHHTFYLSNEVWYVAEYVHPVVVQVLLGGQNIEKLSKS